jgi:predicted nucleic acid-binding protein
MIVVSNTSPLTNLAAIGQFELLRKLFHEIHIAEGVWRELNAGGQPRPGSREVAASPWVHRHRAGNESLVSALRKDLDRGESETLALGVELKADIVLIDEKEGRHTATCLALRPLGVLGILLQAKKQGEVPEIRTSLDALRQNAGFFVAGDLYRWVLAQAGEAS